MSTFAASLRAAGARARRAMLPMESCPWLRGDTEACEVLGDRETHDASCPWCAGWAEEERALFAQAMGAKL